MHVNGQATANARLTYLLEYQGITSLISDNEQRPGLCDVSVDVTARSVRYNELNEARLFSALKLVLLNLLFPHSNLVFVNENIVFFS